MASFWERAKRYLFGPGGTDGGDPLERAGPTEPSTPAAPQKPFTDRPRPATYEANPEIMALSADEMRKRALRINPYQTPWIGRVDTIPPQSDERTALIDRGLVLRGFLTEPQLAQIHTVGDLWLKHKDAISLAKARASKTAEAAIEQQRQERALLKKQKQEAAAQRRLQRFEDVARRKREDIVFLGRGVSRGLADRRSDIEALTARGLPILSTPADVAKAMGVPVPQLRWLCFHSEAAERTHYVYFEVPKRSGGTRLLSAPHEKLGRAQKWVLDEILNKLPTESSAHGFIRGRSTVTNAREHLQRDLVINLDLEDFFPSIGFRRVRGVFRRLGYSPAVATVLALLCTEAPRAQVEYGGKRLWVAAGERALPQGACTSPALSNQIARRLDRRLKGRMVKAGWSYTRYADDLTFSAPSGKRDQIGRIHAAVRHVVQEEGFRLNLKKGRVQSTASRQTVTGIGVNEKPGLARTEVRRIRAILHGARKTGLQAQNREQHENFEAWLQGKIAYLCMVDRDKGLKYLQEFEDHQSKNP